MAQCPFGSLLTGGLLHAPKGEPHSALPYAGGSKRGTQSPTHAEVLGIHVQLVAVQLAQFGVRGLDVVQVLHGVPKGGQHLLAVGTDLGVADDGGGAGEVPEGREKPLGPGVDDQQPRERETGGFAAAFLHVDLAPQAGNELLLFGCPVHHGDERGVLCRCS
uniref:Uncharacterized protein n=1 Tax=Gopherus evgoodei TaxID=1825980 RepID=A0A8C5F2W8_9SAUR